MRQTGLAVGILRLLSGPTADTPQSAKSYFIHPPDAGVALLYGTDETYTLGSTIQVQWVTNLSTFGIWLWQQDTVTGIASVNDRAIYEQSDGPSPGNVDWEVSTNSFKLSLSNIFFFNIGPYASLQDNQATCHYFNISDVAVPTLPITTTNTPSSTETSSFKSAAPTSSSTSWPSTTSPTHSSSFKGTSSITSTTGTSTETTASASIVRVASGTNSNPSPMTTKIGLGVGLGIGIPMVLILAGFLTITILRYRKMGKRCAASHVRLSPPMYSKPELDTEQTRYEVHEQGKPLSPLQAEAAELGGTSVTR